SELLHPSMRQRGQLDVAETRNDVPVDEYPVLGHGGGLALLALDERDPLGGGLPHHDGFSCRGVDSGSNIDFDAGVVGVSILLALECLEPPRALAVRVGHDPCLALLAPVRLPLSLSD